MLFNNVGGCAKTLLYALLIVIIGMVIICIVPGCSLDRAEPPVQIGEGNKNIDKPTNLDQKQLGLKINNNVDNSQKETNVDNRVNFTPIPPVKMPDAPELPKFPDMFLSSAGAIPNNVKCNDVNSCPITASATPTTTITAAAPNVNIDLNPVLAQQQERVLALAADTHRRELESVEKNYAARLASTEASMKQQIELMQKQADVTNQLAEKRINEKEREIAALAQGEAVKIRATEEKWRILAWSIGIGLGIFGLVALLIRSPIDWWRDRKNSTVQG